MATRLQISKKRCAIYDREYLRRTMQNKRCEDKRKGIEEKKLIDAYVDYILFG